MGEDKDSLSTSATVADSTYNRTNDKVKVPVVDAAYVAGLLARVRAAREAFRKASARFHVGRNPDVDNR